MPKLKNVSGYDQVVQEEGGPRVTVAAGSEVAVSERTARDIDGRPGWEIVREAAPKSTPTVAAAK